MSQNLKSEVAFFSRPEVVMPLPGVYSHWAHKYFLPKTFAVSDARTNVDFYASAFLAIDCPSLQMLGIGSGLAQMDINVARVLHATGRLGHYDCIEVTPARVEAANKSIEAAGLSNVMRSRVADVGSWTPDREYNGVIATHVLHHIEPLECLFDNIKACLAPGGRFATMDMIGRNGHQRWPEVRTVVDAIWRSMPERYKFNHTLKRWDSQYDDRDYSVKTNEGIRAQDILPLLMERFHFVRFAADGGIIEPLLDRAYGLNLSREKPEDLLFVDQIAFLNDTLIDAGLIKPTMMHAVMANEPQAPRIYRTWTPEFCVRPRP